MCNKSVQLYCRVCRDQSRDYAPADRTCVACSQLIRWSGVTFGPRVKVTHAAGGSPSDNGRGITCSDLKY